MFANREIVVVTGSSGFIGRPLVERLAAHYTVVGLDREIPPHPPVVAECVCIDLTSQSSIQTALQRVRVAYGEHLASVIHLAAYFDLSGEPNPKYEEITVRGTERLLRELQTFRLEQFVFASSMLIHAPSRPGQRIDENSPLDPKKLPYRESKITAERTIHEHRGDVPVVYLRPAGVYDDQGHAAFLAHQIARIYERKLTSRVYPGNLDAGQPYLHLEDLIVALVRTVERRRSLPRETALLLGEEETLSFRALQEQIGCLIYGEQWQTHQIPQTLARVGAAVEEDILENDPFIRPWMVDASSDHYELDLSRARSLLEWEPKRSLRATLPTIVAHLHRDPSGWYQTNKLNPAVVADRAPAVREQAAMKHGHEEMAEHSAQMQQMHLSTLWVHFTNMMLGAWLATSPLVFGSFHGQEFSEAVLRVTAERNLAPPELRMALFAWSDVISGALIMLFAALSLSRRFSWAQWANAAVGIWLLFASLVFWSPSAAVYMNETLVGALVIAFAILVPMMPGMSHASMMDRSDLPIGWTYSPSTYEQRLPIIALGFVGLLISRVLTAYQLGHIESVWEPFFAGQGGRNGTEFIITSDVSKAWPIPDAGLGAVSYLFEVLMGVMGGRQRWRTMPWMVAAFGIVVVPLGVVSIYFIIIQPIMIGTWCTLCLAAALAMLIMIPFTLDELVAMGQYLVQSHRRGERVLRTFFMGGASPGSGKDHVPGFGAGLTETARAGARGVTVPWTLLVSAVLGATLMFTRLLFGTEPPMADSDHLVGALIVTVAVMAMAEVGRTLRFINVLFGLWLIIAPWMLEGESAAGAWAGVVVGILIILLSLPRGARSREHYGSWDRYVL
ncbi:MAG: NAD-dependent epimerase/dehydratase family protein [Steroidobacter sp.]